MITTTYAAASALALASVVAARSGRVDENLAARAYMRDPATGFPIVVELCRPECDDYNLLVQCNTTSIATQQCADICDKNKAPYTAFDGCFDCLQVDANITSESIVGPLCALGEVNTDTAAISSAYAAAASTTANGFQQIMGGGPMSVTAPGEFSSLVAAGKTSVEPRAGSTGASAGAGSSPNATATNAGNSTGANETGSVSGSGSGVTSAPGAAKTTTSPGGTAPVSSAGKVGVSIAVVMAAGLAVML